MAGLSSRARKPVRMLAVFMAVILSMAFQLIPPSFGITVEEQAGRRERAAEREYPDEFSRKIPERREAARRGPERDPRLACLLALLIPGGGHIYLRDDLKGVGFCLLTGAAYGASGYYLYQAFQGDYSGTEKKSKLVVAGLFMVVGAIIHVVGIVEAYNDAIEINERNVYYGAGRSLSPYVAGIEYER